MWYRSHLDTNSFFQIDRGYISPQFVTNQERQIVEYDNCKILVTDHKIENIKTIVPILEKISQINAPLLIIAGNTFVLRSKYKAL